MALGAAIVQRVSGFGFGIFIMTVLPYLMPTYGEALTLSGTLAIVTVALSGSASYDRQPGEKTDANPDWYYKPGAGLSWELDFWGRVRRSVEAAAADLATAEQNLLDSRRLLAAQLASSYIALRTAQARLDYARKNVELQADTLELVRSRCEAGLNPDLDLRQAELNLATTRAGIPALEA